MSIETQTTVMDVVNVALEPVLYHLQQALEKVKDSPILKSPINTAVLSISSAQDVIAEQYNRETNEFNQLLDELEKTQSLLTTKSLEVSVLNKNIVTLEQQLSEHGDKANTPLISQLEKDIVAKIKALEAKEAKVLSIQKRLNETEERLASANLKLNEIAIKLNKAEVKFEQQKVELAKSKKQTKDATLELKEMKALQPQKLKVKIKQQKKKIEEKQKIIESQKSIIIKQKKDNEDLNKIKADSLLLADKIIDLKKKISYVNGSVHDLSFRRKDSKCVFYIHIFPYGLNNKCKDKSMKLIQDLDFHFEIKTSLGLNLTVSLTEWFQGYFPVCEELSEHWVPEINETIHNEAINKLKDSHKDLYGRILWAKEKKLQDLPIRKALLRKLNDTGFDTVYSIVKFPESTIKPILIHNNNSFQDITDYTIKKLYKILNNAAEKWKFE